MSIVRFDKARNLSRRLAAVPSVIFGTLYLVTWIAFAAAYSVMSTQFYHTTTKLEEGNRNLQWDLTGYFDEILNRSLAAQHANKVGADWQLHTGGAHVTGVEAENGILLIHMRMLIERDSSPDIARLHPVLKCDHVWFLPTKHQHVYSVTIDASANAEFFSRNSISGNDVLTALLGRYRLAGDESGIYVDDYHHEAIEMLIVRERGLTTLSLDTFVRMLYFSAITITTVGYGDILPITTLSRICVSLEAIFGIVLIGLFLNSIAHEMTNPT